MKTFKHKNNAAMYHMEEVGARVVAKSGRPSDRHHLGKLILHLLQEDPHFISQIDGASNLSETQGSVLKRTKQCARSFQKRGLKHGDVIVLLAPNHLDLAIPVYAALYLGITISAIDRSYNGKELESIFRFLKPNIVFCQQDKVKDVQDGLNVLSSDAQIVAFDEGEYCHTFAEFMKTSEQDTTDDFVPSDFDPEETIAFAVVTSGTTGTSKAASLSHKNLAVALPYAWCFETNFPTPVKVALLLSPLQWITGVILTVSSVLMKVTRLQTTSDTTVDHVYHLINTYKPSFSIIGPAMLATLLDSEQRHRCDFSSLQTVITGGSPVPDQLLEEFRKVSPNLVVENVYGSSEIGGFVFMGDSSPRRSCGSKLAWAQVRLINVVTQEDVVEPNKPGELWMKGPNVFKGYFNNPSETKAAFTQDGWFKTGDIFYRDEHFYYYFVERIKLLLKYKSYQIMPLELENLIRQHPGVRDVVVTSIPHPEFGDLAVACVQLQRGAKVTAQEIKHLVKENLSDSKQLRGGVIFMEKFPLTATHKVNRGEIKKIVANMKRE